MMEKNIDVSMSLIIPSACSVCFSTDGTILQPGFTRKATANFMYTCAIVFSLAGEK
jgi:hypothetical protein